MKKRFLLFIAVILLFVTVQSQTFTTAAKDAYVIVRMVEKFHFQPQKLDDQFSEKIYTQFLKALDDDRIFFRTQDLSALQLHKYNLDNQIRNKQTDFLQLAFHLYKKRLNEAQIVINAICKNRFNFYIHEKFTIAEDTSYTNNLSAWHNKIYKIVKLAVLNKILRSNANISSLSYAEVKRYIQTAEPLSRLAIQNAFNKSFNNMLYQGSGLQKILADQYCKTIALCYDPHTEYFPTEDDSPDSEPTEKEIIFGFTIKKNEKGFVFIEGLKPGSLAYKSGQINYGDKIAALQWEGEKIVIIPDDATVKDISKLLNVNREGKIILTLKKADGLQTSVTLAQQPKANDAGENKVKSFLLTGEKKIGFISLPAFYEDWESDKGINGCANDVAKEIVKLKKENIEGLIIDIRYNEGGSMQEAIEMAGIFIDIGPVAQYKTKVGMVTLKDANKGTIYEGPLGIMVNGYTASASEMLAGILQDYNRAIIIGSPTYGKATTQLVLPLDTAITRGSKLKRKNADGFLQITAGEIYRLTGKTIQATGVMPDIILPDIKTRSEKDNEFFISLPTISENKYYQPADAINFTNMLSETEKIIASSDYFTKMKDNPDPVRATIKKDVSLHISDALILQKQIPLNTDDVAKNILFNAENHKYDNDRIALNKTLYEVNKEWRKHISQDVYINATYHLMLQLIK